jgi:hypothetical protein
MLSHVVRARVGLRTRVGIGLPPLAAEASRQAAWLVAFIRPACALLAPSRAGASTPKGGNPIPTRALTLRRLRHGLLAVLVLLAAPFSQNAFAQFELTGSWAARNTEDVSNDSFPVDYVGLPLNDEGRTRALTYNESQLAMIERQCEGWPAFYFVQGPFGLKIWSEMEPVRGTVISYTIGAWEDRAPITVWMDGRPRPSMYAEHTRGGFTTGRWEGDTLVTSTTHMKAGFLRKNGPPSSDRASMTSRFFRHGDLLTVLVVVDDPVYLTEPHVFTKSFQIAAAPVSPIGPPCISGFEGRQPGDSVPHFTPEQNPFVDEMTRLFNLPRAAVLGETETLYPEYRKKIRGSYVRPEPCKQDCGPTPLR